MVLGFQALRQLEHLVSMLHRCNSLGINTESRQPEWGYSLALQPYFGRSVLAEERPFTDVPPQHREVLVASLLHDHTLAYAGLCGCGRQSGA